MIREFLKYLSLELNRSRLTVKAYETDLRGFNEYMIKSGVPVGDTGFFIPEKVSSSDIREWMAVLIEEGTEASSVRRKVQSLRAFYKFLLKKGIVLTNPASLVNLPKIRRRLPTIATHDDIQNSIETSSSLRDILIMKLLYGFGLRRSEIIGIDDNDINMTSKELKILGKGNKHRVLPLPDEMITLITEWQRERDETYAELPNPKPLLATSRGRMSASTLYNIIRNLLSSTSAEKKSPHTLRHSFATQLLNSGAEINSVKALLGHSSLGATQIYTHLAFSELTKEWTKAHPRAKKSN